MKNNFLTKILHNGHCVQWPYLFVYFLKNKLGFIIKNCYTSCSAVFSILRSHPTDQGSIVCSTQIFFHLSLSVGLISKFFKFWSLQKLLRATKQKEQRVPQPNFKYEKSIFCHMGSSETLQRPLNQALYVLQTYRISSYKTRGY